MTQRPMLSLDLDEYGLEREGHRQRSSNRLFMQLLAFETHETGTLHDPLQRIIAALERTHVPAVLYEDVNHPSGLGLLSWNQNPDALVTGIRRLVSAVGADWTPRPQVAMLGRTYSTGFETDLDHWLLQRPLATVLNPNWHWAIWYPLRRKGSFETLDAATKSEIMREHGGLGRAYGEANLAHDIRLACHGLDPQDNDFVIGLVGPQLFPLSHVVQAMRRTRQTREFIEKMGPFFVGRALWRRGESV